VSAALQRIGDLRRACEHGAGDSSQRTAWTPPRRDVGRGRDRAAVYACHAAWYEAQEALLHAQGMHAAAEYLAAERLAAAIARRYERRAPSAGPTTETAEVGADDTMEIGDGSIAEVLSGKAKANARLIAAAPELYEALRDLLHEDGPSRNSWERARSALAKAEGR
jgi:hypothetical protein